MSLSHLVLAILALLIAGTLLTLKAEETLRIDPECGHEYRTELCNGYLYAKYNDLPSADRCDDEKDDPEINFNEEFHKGCLSFFDRLLVAR